MQQVANDFRRPQKAKPKPFYEGKTEASSALPLVGTEGLRLRAGLWKSLAQTGYERVKLTHVLGAVRWPVLKWPRMAGFEVATEAETKDLLLALGAENRLIEILHTPWSSVGIFDSKVSPYELAGAACGGFGRHPNRPSG